MQSAGDVQNIKKYKSKQLLFWRIIHIVCSCSAGQLHYIHHTLFLEPEVKQKGFESPARSSSKRSGEKKKVGFWCLCDGGSCDLLMATGGLEHYFNTYGVDHVNTGQCNFFMSDTDSAADNSVHV